MLLPGNGAGNTPEDYRAFTASRDSTAGAGPRSIRQGGLKQHGAATPRRTPGLTTASRKKNGAQAERTQGTAPDPAAPRRGAARATRTSTADVAKARRAHRAARAAHFATKEKLVMPRWSTFSPRARNQPQPGLRGSRRRSAGKVSPTAASPSRRRFHLARHRDLDQQQALPQADGHGPRASLPAEQAWLSARRRDVGTHGRRRALADARAGARAGHSHVVAGRA